MKISFFAILMCFSFFFYEKLYSQCYNSNRMVYQDSSYYQLELCFNDFVFYLYSAPNEGFKDFNRVNKGHFNIVNDKIYFHSILSAICYKNSSFSNINCKSIDSGVYKDKNFNIDSILIYLDYCSDNVHVVRNLKDTFELDSGMNLIPYSKGDSLYISHYLYFAKIPNLNDSVKLIKLYPFRSFLFYNLLDFPIKGVFIDNAIIVDFDVQSNVVLRNK